MLDQHEQPSPEPTVDNMRQRLEFLEAEKAALTATMAASAQQKISARLAKNRNLCRPSFGVVVWALFSTLTALWIIDRFTWQINPRQLYSIGSAADGRGRVAGDPTKVKEGPFSVAFYDIFARISGRLLTMYALPPTPPASCSSITAPLPPPLPSTFHAGRSTCSTSRR